VGPWVDLEEECTQHLMTGCLVDRDKVDGGIKLPPLGRDTIPLDLEMVHREAVVGDRPTRLVGLEAMISCEILCAPFADV